MEDVRYKNSYKAQCKHASSLAVYNAGYAECEGNFRWGPGVRNHFLLHHVVSGEGSYVSRGITHPIHAGTTFCAFPGEMITYTADVNKPWAYVWVGFNGNDAKLLMAQTDFSEKNPVISGWFDGKLQKLMLQIYAVRGNSPADSARMVGKLYEVLALFMQSSSVSRCEGGDIHVKNAVTFMKHNYACDISIGDIAASAAISRSQLCRLFQATFSCSPVQYLTQYRIDCARDLISQTQLSIEAVAHSVGYYDALYFTRVFGRIVGIPPIRYREASYNKV